MSTRVVDRVEDWDERSFTGGHRELHDLADREFSGVVRAGGAELFMTKGVVVGVRQGAIEDFEDANGTIYAAPSPGLPLLAVMQERGGEVRDQFYTEKTSISEVDSTLSDGGFTGYIELSENVLSGDYYLVYHAGRSMSIGFVGESARLIDGDEAFETADDEVGIYKVHAVDVEPVEIPEPGGPATGGSAGTTDTGGSGTGTGTGSGTAGRGADEGEPAGRGDAQPTAGTERGTDDPPVEDRGTPAEASSEAAGRRSTEQTTQDPPAAGSGGRSGGGSADTEQATADADATDTAEERQRTDRSSSGRDEAGTPAGSRESAPEPAESSSGTQAGGQAGRQAGGSRADAPDAGAEPASQPGDRQEPQASGAGTTGDRAGSGGAADPSNQGGGWDQEAARGRAPAEGTGSAGADEALGLEQRAIPSLDPDRSDESDAGGGSARDSLERSRGREPGDGQSRQPERRGTDGVAKQQPSEPATGTRAETQQPGGQGRRPQNQQPQGGQPSEAAAPSREPQPEPGVDPERVEELEADLEEREAEIDRLQDELASATAERDELREELEAVREERDELRAEVERLEGELTRVEEELGAATDAERRITGEEALSGTDVFVRYHSKGDATLEKAHSGSTRTEDVNENLRLEKHTQFDAEAVAVGAQSYEEYLDNTVEYQFVEWLVRQLLFEIRETGHQKELKNLYDVLPAVDRAELSGIVDVVYTADGQETRSQEAFDIILRDRMGNPLLVANLNDSREAATEDMMEDLITAAERVGQSADQFAGAFLVTRSFFDPGALEVAEEATQGGLLSRDKRKSFVNLSRKQGYHLCLVEARNENFHLAVPEL